MLVELARTIREVFGARGAAWLAELPTLIGQCEHRWAITVATPFKSCSYNWVAPARMRDGTDVVLKLGVPCPELANEIEALRAFAGRGCARLIEADSSSGALLIERLRPGTMLVELGLEHDDAATAIAAALLPELNRSPPAGVALPTLAVWTEGITCAKSAGFAPSLIDTAVRLRDELLASASSPVLLHGDLHHFNILRAERQPWLAIDPKGIVGDPAYEMAPFLYNPLNALRAAPDGQRIVLRRIDRLAEYLDRERLIRWSFVQSVLSAWWSFEDHGREFEPALTFAEWIAQLL